MGARYGHDITQMTKGFFRTTHFLLWGKNQLMLTVSLLQAQMDAAFTVEMQLIRYVNWYSWTYYSNHGYCCDNSSHEYRYSTDYCRRWQCDNYFDICIRSTGYTTVSTSSSICTYGRTVTPVAGDDDFSFSSLIGRGSSAISNPIVFTYAGPTRPVRAVNDRSTCLRFSICELSSSTEPLPTLLERHGRRWLLRSNRGLFLLQPLLPV